MRSVFTSLGVMLCWLTPGIVNGQSLSVVHLIEPTHTLRSFPDSLQLSWEGDAERFEVILDTTRTPTKLAGTTAERFLFVRGLPLWRRLYWKVEGYANDQLVSESPVDSFSLPQTMFINTPADAGIRRALLREFIWGAPGFPDLKKPSLVERNVRDSRCPSGRYAAMVDRYTIEMDLGFVATVFRIQAQRRNGRLLVVHHGHSDNLGEAGVDRLIEAATGAGYDVLAFWMPCLGGNVSPALQDTAGVIHTIRRGSQGHNDLEFIDTQGLLPHGRTVKFFVEPVAVALNQALSEYPYSGVAMAGLSGGGWTTGLYAAIDPRVQSSYPVAGTSPRYLFTVNNGGRDYEQEEQSILSVAGELDQYLLAVDTPGRKQLQIFNIKDDCCFYGNGPDTYVDEILRRSRGNGGGDFRIWYDPYSTHHMVSDSATAMILRNDLGIHAPWTGASVQAAESLAFEWFPADRPWALLLDTSASPTHVVARGMSGNAVLPGSLLEPGKTYYWSVVIDPGSPGEYCTAVYWFDYAPVQEAPGVVCDSSLILQLRFDGHVADVSGFGHRVRSGGIILAADREGHPASAARFDGTTGHVDVVPDSLLALGTGDFTVSWWIKAPSQIGGTHDYAMLFGKNEQAWPYRGVDIMVSDAATGPAIEFRLSADIGVGTSRSVCDDQWHHVSCVRQGSRLSIFVDGTREATNVLPVVDISVPDILTIGANNAQITSQNLEGTLDDVRLYRRALEEWEVRALAEGRRFAMHLSAPSVPGTGSSTNVHLFSADTNRVEWDVRQGGEAPGWLIDAAPGATAGGGVRRIDIVENEGPRRRAEVVCYDQLRGTALVSDSLLQQSGVPHLLSPGQDAAVRVPQVRLSWSRTIGNQATLVEVSTDSAFGRLEIGPIITASQVAEVRGLQSNARYWWRARAVFQEQDTSDWARSAFEVVANPPVFTVNSLGEGVEGQYYSSQVHAMDPDSGRFGDIVRYRAISLPSWMELDTVRGILRGVPTGMVLRDTLAVIEAHDGYGLSTVQAFALKIAHVNHPPAFASAPSLQAVEDHVYEYAIRAVDPDSANYRDRLSCEVRKSPGWLVFDRASNVLRGVPGPNDVGAHTVLVEVQDDSGAVARQEFTLVVDHQNHPPVIIGISKADFTAVEHEVFSRTLGAEDADLPLYPDRLHWSLATAPSWLAIDSVSAELTGVPPEGAVDTVLLVCVSDGALSDTAWIPLHIIPVNDPPELTHLGTVVLEEDGAVTLPLDHFVSDPDNRNDELSWKLAMVSADDPSGATRTSAGHGSRDDSGERPGLLVASASLSDSLVISVEGMPRVLAIRASRNYTCSNLPVRLTVFDRGGLAASDTFSVTVQPVNDPPVLAGLDPVCLLEDDSVELPLASLLRSLTDPDDPPADHQWTISSSGSVRGRLTERGFILTPVHDWNGTDTLTVTVSDRQGKSCSAPLVVAVAPVNDRVVLRRLSDDSTAYAEILFVLPIACHDPDGPDSLIRYRWSGPDWLHVTERGSLEGRPHAVGRYSGVLSAADPEGGTDSLLITIHVRSIDEAHDLANSLPAEFVLKQNYPNPFNPSTTLRFGVPVPSTVRLVVYTILGQRLQVIEEGTWSAGYHEVRWNAAGVSSGVYLLEMTARSKETPLREFRAVRRLLLAK